MNRKIITDEQLENFARNKKITFDGPSFISGTIEMTWRKGYYWGLKNMRDKTFPEIKNRIEYTSSGKRHSKSNNGKNIKGNSTKSQSRESSNHYPGRQSSSFRKSNRG